MGDGSGCRGTERAQAIPHCPVALPVTADVTRLLVSNTMRWLDVPSNRAHVEALRERMAGDVARVVLFLGAGLSFGASRRGRKSLAERDFWGVADSGGTADDDSNEQEASEIIINDDAEPFPTWSRLKSRMRQKLSLIRDRDQASLNRFFRTSDPLDCAQLFRNVVGDTNYFQFLRQQYRPESPVDYWITPSHDALVELDLPLLFTTNYDDLIERAYTHHSKSVTVSATADEFIDHSHPVPERHLVKLHGTIDRVDTVVVTRDDYAKARHDRRRIYEELRLDVAKTTYIFVGFSLSDPNVNILLDDARLETRGQLPPSYTVQGRYDQTIDDFYRSRGINVIWIDTWDLLPSFLKAVNPGQPLKPPPTAQ